MKYLIDLNRSLNSTDKSKMEELNITIIYESKFVPCIGVDIKSKRVLEDLDFIAGIRIPMEGNFQEGEFASTITFEPPIKRSILVNNNLVGWGDTRIAVLDSGVNPDVSIADAIDFTGTGIKDGKPHGNDVAKIVKFFAKGASLYIAKIGHDKPDELNLMQAIEWAVSKGAKVINISAGFNRECKGACQICRLVDEVSKLGVIIVVAAGNRDNEMDSIDCPGHAVHAVTVGAVNKHEKIADYSSFGKIDEGKPNIVAPGNLHIDGRYITGTSFSSPLVSGVIGAILNRVGSTEKAIEYIYNTAVDLGFAKHQQGVGLISIKNLVEAIVNEEDDIRDTGQNRSS